MLRGHACMCITRRYTSHGAAAGSFEAALDAWEGAAAALLQQQCFEAQVQQLRAALQHHGVIDGDGSGLPTCCTFEQAQQLLWGHIAAREQLRASAALLQELAGAELRVHGAAAAGSSSAGGAAAVAIALQPLLDEAWACLGGGAACRQA